jgi:hypothetical protein
MCRQPHLNARFSQAAHYKIPRRANRGGKERSANQAFYQAQRAFRKHSWRIARTVPEIKIGG